MQGNASKPKYYILTTKYYIKRTLSSNRTARAIKKERGRSLVTR